MWPLLRKDGLETHYIAMTLLWNRLVGHDPFVALSHATYLDMLTWVRLFYTHWRLVFLKPPELGGLPGLCPASLDGDRIPSTSTISRLVPRP